MKWLLIVITMSGGIDSAEFESKDACQSASITLNIAAARHILREKQYVPHVEAFCAQKGIAPK